MPKSRGFLFKPQRLYSRRFQVPKTSLFRYSGPLGKGSGFGMVGLSAGLRGVCKGSCMDSFKIFVGG